MNNRALVIKSTGNFYQIETENGEILEAQLRGKFRTQNIKHTNPIAVGDWIQYEIDQQNNAQIHTIEDRQNYLIRKSVNLSKQTHIIASNIDALFVMVTLKNPRTSIGFIDRILVTAEAYNIPAKLLFNKIDTYDDIDFEMLESYKNIYENIGYECFEVSALNQTNLDGFLEVLKDQVSLITGHSGVGKSTLVNALTGLDLKTAIVSDFNEKGKHTTTFAQMIKLKNGGYLVDTPGIKEFGLVNMEEDEVQDYFPEIFALKQECKFNNCLHKNEPKCAVKEAVSNDKISIFRYENYLKFLEEDVAQGY